MVAEDLRGPSGQPVRIEMFAHGAFCMAVSGKCYLSLDRLGSSANRGACLQVCRRSYRVSDLESGEELIVDNKYIMSPKDLCTIEFMDKFIEAGVKIFKIEGRARSAEYVRRTAACYRRAADAVCEGTYTPELTAALKAQLAEVFNRGFWDGYWVSGAPCTAARRPAGKSVSARLPPGSTVSAWPSFWSKHIRSASETR